MWHTHPNGRRRSRIHHRRRIRTRRQKCNSCRWWHPRFRCTEQADKAGAAEAAKMAAKVVETVETVEMAAKVVELAAKVAETGKTRM